MGWPVLVVVPDGGGEGEDALQDAGATPAMVRPPWRSRSSLAFEGVVDRLDDLPQRFEVAVCRRAGLALAGRAQQLDAGLGEGGFERLAVVVLVADQYLLRVRGNQAGSAAKMASSTSRSSALAPVSANATGSPAGCTTDAAAGPRSSGSARRSSRTRPSRPDPSVSPSPGSGRTRRGWSRPPTHRRCTAGVGDQRAHRAQHAAAARSRLL